MSARPSRGSGMTRAAMTHSSKPNKIQGFAAAGLVPGAKCGELWFNGYGVGPHRACGVGRGPRDAADPLPWNVAPERARARPVEDPGKKAVVGDSSGCGGCRAPSPSRGERRPEPVSRREPAWAGRLARTALTFTLAEAKAVAILRVPARKAVPGDVQTSRRGARGAEMGGLHSRRPTNVLSVRIQKEASS